MPPLIIDATPADIRFLASGLELRNDKAIHDALRDNQAIRERNKQVASERIDKAAEIGAEYVKDASTKTSYAPLEERLRYYHPNE